MIHEDFNRAESTAKSSDRAFGLVIATALTIAGLWPLISGKSPHVPLLYVAGALVVVAIVSPGVLAWPNRSWARFGQLLGRVTGPIILGILFYLVFAPFGLFMRAFRKDPLRLTRDREASTYWIERVPPGPAPYSLTEQF